MAQKGCTLWFTGLSASGKSTISDVLEIKLRDLGLKVEVMDGDVVRENLSKGLGFSKEDRDTNILRIGYVCHLLTRNGVVAIAAAISPYKAIRDKNRELIKDFIEIYVATSLEECAKRDPKGLYKKAFAGIVKNFTGVSDPYEPPENPELTIDTLKNTPAECADIIIRKMIEMGYLPSDKTEPGGVYSKEEEEVVKKRLEELGYI